MLQPDECDLLLANNPFADDTSTISSGNCHNHDSAAALSSSFHHPLFSRPLSPCSCNTPNVLRTSKAADEDNPRPSLTALLSSDSSAEVAAAEDWTRSASEACRGGSDAIMHTVAPNDSFAGVALHYGVSIAALRRANQLWPTDPIHLRTELLIPRGNILHARYRASQSPVVPLTPAVETVPDFPPDLVTSSFIAARNAILSVLPARISLDSLSSKTTANEDHELDDLQAPRKHKMSTDEASVGHELSVIPVSRGRYGLSSQFHCSPTNNQRQPMDLNHISVSPVGNMHPRSTSLSHTASLERLSHRQSFVLPVRTSQLKPEPAMELPVRRSRI